MATYPVTRKAYPVTPKAYPATPKAYPGTGVSSFPISAPTLGGDTVFNVDIVASVLSPLLADTVFTLDIVASNPALTASIFYLKRGVNLTLSTTMRAIGGASPPVVTLAAGSGSLTFSTGCPGLWVDILVGAVTFDLSFDNGATVSFAAQTIPVGGGNYTIPSGTFAGMIIGFPLGTYDAATVYHGAVATWATASGSGSYSFTSATAAQQPIYEVAGLDGEPCLLFGTGTNERLVSTDAAVYATWTDQPLFELLYKVKFNAADAAGTVFCVANTANATTNKRRVSQTTTGAGRTAHVWNDSTVGSGSIESISVSANPDLYDWFTPTAGAGATITLLVDGAATSIANSAAATGTLGPNCACIGITNDSSPDSPLAGRLGSLVMFDHELAGADRTAWSAEIENAP